jgi:hypothetical protein
MNKSFKFIGFDLLFMPKQHGLIIEYDKIIYTVNIFSDI